MGEISEDGPDDIEGLDASVAHIANMLSTKPADIKLGIGGFSMGAATALYSATCFTQGKYGNGNPYPINLRAIVGLSGWLPGSRLFEYLSENSLNFPVILHIKFPKGIHRDDLVIGAGTNARALLVDGLGDGILLEAPDQDFDFLRNTSFNLLQGCRMRNTKTEYVSCPSCGRTLFDLQEISAEIREKTSHLPGVSIAIMGCIVNGPGEMADADFGYVGGAPGKIDLYVGKTVVKRAIAMEQATGALIQLIKDHGRWVDPPAEE